MNRRPPDLDDLLETMLERRAGRPVPGWLFDTILSTSAEAPQAPRRFTLRDVLPTTPQSRVIWLAAMLALLVGATIAVSLAAGPRPLLIADGSPSPLVAASPTGVTSPSAAASPTPSATPTLPATPIPPPDGLAANTIAVVTPAGDSLRVRTAPGVGAASERLEPLLATGQSMFVVSGPITADGYVWYEVLPTGDVALYGWVAAASKDGIAWIEPATTPCPAAFDGPALATLEPAILLACFGSQPVTFDAVIGTESGIDTGDSCESPNGCVRTPSWLLDGQLVPVTIPAGSQFAHFAMALAPEMPNLELLRSGTLPGELDVHVTAAFDHPAAVDCRITDGPNGPELGPPSQWITQCRMQLVASSITWDADAVALRPDTFAWVVTDDLRVRSAPGVGPDSKQLEPLLEDGESLFVLEGPVTKDGYDWYHVRPFARWARPSGWVAAASRSGEPWLSRASGPDCPPAGDWASLANDSWFSGEHLACFGDQEIVSTLWVHELQPAQPGWNRGCDTMQNWGLSTDPTHCAASPIWLTGFTGLEISPDEPPVNSLSLWVTFDPSTGLTRESFPTEWTWMTVRGSYSHPASDECRVTDTSTGADLLDPAEARFYCRLTFVVTSLEPANPP